jgi:hypothetical protein
VRYDTVSEGPESFYVDLSTPLNATLTEATRATVNIVDNDSTTLVTRTAADFAAGTLEGGAHIAQQWDGELILRPALSDEFLGPSLPAGWPNTALTAGGGSVVVNGMVNVDGAALLGPSMYGSVKNLEVSATFRQAPGQTIGFGVTDALVAPMAMFVLDGNLQLVARTLNGAAIFESPIAGVDWLGIPHRYGINWNAGNVQFLVDGVVVMTHTTAWGAAQMRPVLRDGAAGDGALTVDWLRMSPYATPGTYTSVVFDAVGPAAWTKLTLAAVAATGTTQTLWFRSGNSPDPNDGTWTAFAAPGTGGVLTATGQYGQYQIRQATTAVARTPTAKDVTLVFKRQ